MKCVVTLANEASGQIGLMECVAKLTSAISGQIDMWSVWSN